MSDDRVCEVGSIVLVHLDPRARPQWSTLPSIGRITAASLRAG